MQEFFVSMNANDGIAPSCFSSNKDSGFIFSLNVREVAFELATGCVHSRLLTDASVLGEILHEARLQARMSTSFDDTAQAE